MKYLVSLLFFVMCCVKSIAQTYIEPVFDRTDYSILHIDSLIITNDTTFVHCTLTMVPNSWGTISGDTYLYNTETKRKYPMLKCDGLPISPQKRDFLFGGIAPIVFYFPSIENVNKLDFIENPNKRAFNIFGINLKEHYNKSYKAEDYEHFSNVSSIYESENDTLKALENRQKAIEVAKYIDGVKSSRYMGTFLQKCMMYINYKYYQDVINEAKNVLDVVQGDSLANMAFVPAYKFYIGLANLQIKREDEALLWFNESYLDFQSTLDNKRSYIYGCLLNNMANTLSFSGDFDSAYKIAEEACLVGIEQYGENAELYLSALLALSNADI